MKDGQLEREIIKVATATEASQSHPDYGGKQDATHHSGKQRKPTGVAHHGGKTTGGCEENIFLKLTESCKGLDQLWRENTGRCHVAAGKLRRIQPIRCNRIFNRFPALILTRYTLRVIKLV